MLKRCFSILFFAVVLNSCVEEEAKSTDIEELKELIEELQEVKSENKELKAKIRVAKTQGRKKSESKELKRAQNHSIELLDENKKLSEKLSDVETEFSSFREEIQKHIQNARKADIGRRFDKVRSQKDEGFSKVSIVEITDEMIRVKHRSGFTNFTAETAPKGWAQRYFMGVNLGGDTDSLLATSTSHSSSTQSAANDEFEASDEENLHKAVVIISGDGGAGTGFFVDINGGIYLYTAAHVLSGNSQKSLKIVDKAGRRYRKFGRLEIAHGADIARIQMAERVPYALKLPRRSSITDKAPFIALGNPGGGSVITTHQGSVEAMGPKSFEINADLVPGNSGGPIISKGGKTVFGLVTHAIKGKKDFVSSGTRYGNVRRFGARFDVPIKWQRSSLRSFLSEPEKIKKVARVTRLLYALSELRPGVNGLRLDTRLSGGDSALKIFEQNKDMAVVRSILKMNTSLARKKIRPDAGALNKHYRGLMNKALSAAQSQMRSFKSSTPSPYHWELSKEVRDDRENAVNALKRAISRI